MKKLAILFALLLAVSGCAGSVNVDDLISARELPEYGEILDIEINETEGEIEAEVGEVITIE